MFDIYDPKTYIEVPEGYASIYGNVNFYDSNNCHYFTLKEIVDYIQKNLVSEYSNPLLLKYHIQIYLEWLYNKYSTETKEQKDKRKIIQKEKEIEWKKMQLANIENISKENKFNPRDKNSYKFAKDDVIATIDGVPLYNVEWNNDIKEKNYLTEIDFVLNIYEWYKFEKKISLQDFIKKEIKRYLLFCK